MRWTWLTFDEFDVATWYAVAALRQEVFIVEQDCPYLDLDGLDHTARHLLGHDEQGRLSAYLRVLVGPKGLTIGRVIVAPHSRGTGLGHTLMQRAVEQLWDIEEASSLFLSAQAHLEDYYRKHGFRVCGPGYDEDGIPHVPMLRTR